jgi:hypothetical protein
VSRDVKAAEDSDRERAVNAYESELGAKEEESTAVAATHPVANPVEDDDTGIVPTQATLATDSDESAGAAKTRE